MAVPHFKPIGVLSSHYKERFGIPRQSGLVPAAEAILTLESDPRLRQAIRGLEEFSHVWLIFVFHDLVKEGWKPMVRPPRLGGKKKMGVFATRSPHRPNPIGLSVVELIRVESQAGKPARLHLRGVDLLDGTPVLDVKPYVPYADRIASAHSGWTDAPARSIPVVFAKEALQTLDDQGIDADAPIKKLMEQTIALDPRPSFHVRRSSPKSLIYSAKIGRFDVHWRVRSGTAEVFQIDVVD